jgi:hydrogenase maturation factor
MCLGVVGQITAVGHDQRVQVSAGNREITASLLAVSETLVQGDWVLVHSGLVLARLTKQEAREALELREPTSEGVP